MVVLLGIEASGRRELIPHRQEQRITDHRSVPCGTYVVLYLLTLTPIPWTVLDLIVTLSHSHTHTHTHTQIKVEGHCTALHFWAGTPRRRAEAVFFFFTHYSLPVVTAHYSLPPNLLYLHLPQGTVVLPGQPAVPPSHFQTRMATCMVLG